jgi:RNA polymerase sigma factor (sigma-70 family)
MATSQISEVIQHLLGAVLLRGGAGLTDGQLLDDYISRRDEAALATLVRRHGPMVWGVCRRVLRNYHDAEDAFQATFLVLVRKAASVASRELLANWLYGVAHQTALKARATAAKRKVRERQVTEMPDPVVEHQDLWNDVQPLLDEELSRLPGHYRAVIVLCELEGVTRKEAARKLGLPEGTVGSRLARARVMLAKRLARRGLVVSGGVLAASLAENAASAGVPSSVVTSTIKAAGLLAAGAATGAISAKVAALTEGVLKSRLLTGYKGMAVLVGTLSALVFLGLTAYQGLAQSPGKGNTPETAKLAAQTPASKDGGGSARGESDAHYCRLVFGPKAKVRVLMRLKGDEVAVDRDGDGEFESKGERFRSEADCKGVVLADPDGQTSYVITHVHVLHVVPPEKFVALRVSIRGAAPSYPQSGVVQMADSPKAAPRAHFYGPLTVTPNGKRVVNRADLLLENDLVNVAGLLPRSVRKMAGKVLGPDSSLPKSLKRDGPTNLFAVLATEGENSGVAVCSPADTDEKRREMAPFPKGVHPSVDVEFPAKQPGGQRIKKRYPLDQLCYDGLYGGPVRVPADAGVGKARVTFSFDTWKGVKAAPTTVEIPVDEPQPSSKGGVESARGESDAHYCWLMFGPKKVRTLVRLKGKEVAVDRDGDGKFDGEGERLASETGCKGVVVADPDGKTSYVITFAEVLHTVPPEKFIETRVKIRGTCPYPEGCIVQMANSPRDAPQAHFHGPLTIAPHGWRVVNRADLLLENHLTNAVAGLLPRSLQRLAGKKLSSLSMLPKSLTRAGEPTELYACVATDGENSHAAVCSPADTPQGRREIAPFPKGVHPFVDVEFPAKRPSDPPLKKRYPLDQFCCDGLYHGPVRVPADAGAGKARVTFSFDAWKGVKVAPTTVEIPVDEPQAEKREQPKPPTTDKSAPQVGSGQEPK